MHLLSTDQEMTPAKNMINAHAQNVVMDEEAFAQYTRSLTQLYIHDVFRLYVLVVQSVAPTNSSSSSLLKPAVLPHRARNARHAQDHLLTYDL